MDKGLETIIDEISKQHKIYLEKLFIPELIVPGLFTINGKDAKDRMDSKGINAIFEDDVEDYAFDPNALDNNQSLTDKEIQEIGLAFFEKFPDTIKDYFQYNVSAIRQILTSIADLIPPELDDEGKIIASCCDFFLEKVLFGVDNAEKDILSLLENRKKENNKGIITKEKEMELLKNLVVQGFVELIFLIINTMWFRQYVYEYFYGPTDKKDEIANKMDQMLSYLVDIKTNQDNTSLSLKNMTESIEQTLKNTETTNNALNEIKECQEKTKELIENRNEEEKPKRLQIAKCANDIRRILQNEYHTSVNKKTIEKYLRRLDTYLEKGIKIPLPTYKYAMYYKKGRFIVWCREEFIPYYLEHRKIRVKNKTPRCSSSDAAFDEAARQKYREEEEENDCY